MHVRLAVHRSLLTLCSLLFARSLLPNTSLRALYGTTLNQNAIHCPESLSANAREISLLFDEYNFDLLG